MRIRLLLFPLIILTAIIWFVVQPTTAQEEAEKAETLTIPISIYVIIEEGNPASEISSQRTEEELVELLELANDIWSQEGIELELTNVATIEVPEEVILSIMTGREFRTFFSEAGISFDVPEPGIINGFYMRNIGGPNGINPLGSRTFFVTDTPSVHDERVTSHEVGHILGLHHTLEDTDRLIYPGTNGMTLSDEEIVVARYVAQGIIDGLR